jgi:PHP-associated
MMMPFVIARERARRESSGHLLVYIDADCRAPLMWLEKIERRFKADSALIAISGNYRFYDWDWFGRTLIRAYDYTLAPATHINGPIAAPHVAALLPWVNALEVINGSRLSVQNRTARCLAEAAGKTGIAGSDSHTHRGIGFTWTEVPGARTREEFMKGLWEGRVSVGGRHGSFFTMAYDVFRFAGNLCLDQARDVRRQPFDVRTHACFFGGILALPLVSIALAGAYLHFVMEERFNENLLFDLVARPAPTIARVPKLAA